MLPGSPNYQAAAARPVTFLGEIKNLSFSGLKLLWDSIIDSIPAHKGAGEFVIAQSNNGYSSSTPSSVCLVRR